MLSNTASKTGILLIIVVLEFFQALVASADRLQPAVVGQLFAEVQSSSFERLALLPTRKMPNPQSTPFEATAWAS